MTHHEHAPQHEDVKKKRELEAAEVKEVLDFLKRYSKPVGTGLCAVLIAILAVNGYTLYKTSQRAKAEQLLLDAETSQQFEAVITKYSSTPSAPSALLALARQFFTSGEPAQARAQYERFLKKYKHHDMVPAAELGLAYCTEAEGDFSDAAQQFDEFSKKYATSYLRPQAILSAARCLKQAGKTEEARVILEDFLAASIGTQRANDAEIALQNLESK